MSLSPSIAAHSPLASSVDGPPDLDSSQRWPQCLHYWPVALVGALGLALVLALAQMREAELASGQLSRAQNTLAGLSARAEVTAQAAFGPVMSLAALIQLDGDITPARFDAMAQKLLAADVHLRSITAAPGDVVRMVYPLQGNEIIKDRDYRDIPDQYASVREAHLRGVPLLVAPVHLLKNFEGILLRMPVFLPSPEGPRYWGVVSGLVELQPYAHLIGLDRPSLPVNAALFEARPGGLPGKLIWGDERIAAQHPLLQVLNPPGGSWVLAAVPKQGWQTSGVWSSPELLGGMLAAFALTLGAAVLTHQRLRLRERNASLNEEIQRGHLTLLELHRSQDRLTSVAALGSDMVWEQDAQFRFTYISAIREPHGLAAAREVIGQRRWEQPGPSGNEWASHIASLERHEPFVDFEYTAFTPHGTRRLSVSGVPLFDAQGSFAGYRGTSRDVTERAQQVAALRESQASQAQTLTRLQALLDAAVEVAIVATDLDGHITLFNEGAQRMLGYTEAQMLGQSPTLFHLHGELELRADELAAELGERPAGFEVLVAQARRQGMETRIWSCISREGQHIAVSATVSRITSRSGELIGFLALGRDVTAQLQAERQLSDMNALLETRVSLRTAELSATRSHLLKAQDELQRTEKMAALGSLVAGVAHELNSPLGNCVTIASALEGKSCEALRALEDSTLRRSGLLDFLKNVSDAADILMRSLQQANDLVQHFKQVSADQASSRRRSFELAATIDDVLTVLRPRLRNSPVQVECDVQLGRELDSFPGSLVQIISNLVQNALLHAFAPGQRGQLWIRARELDAEQLELVIEDNGMGMSAEVRQRAFEPFFTTKLNQGGTGLGLNIVRDLAQGMLGGELELKSEPGHGCRFTFRLPFVAPQITNSASIHDAAEVWS